MKLAVIGDLTVKNIPDEFDVIPYQNDLIADCYVINEDLSQEKLNELVFSLRSNEETALSLIYVYKKPEFTSDIIKDLIDGFWLETNPEQIKNLATFVKNLPPLSPELSEQEKRIILLLRFLWSRQKEKITPYPLITSPIAYHFPIVRIFCKLKPGEEIDIIEQLVSFGILRPHKLVNIVPLCPQDRHYQIIFRDTCPNCSSLELKETELYYHFDCGYIGSKDDFHYKDSLRCPKCNKFLRHLGEDYEIPSKAFKCLNCGHLSEEPKVEVFCLNCQNRFSLQSIIFQEIRLYLTTALAYQVAEDGRLPLYVIEDVFDRLNLIKWNLFQFILEWEQNKFKRYKRPFCLLYIFWDKQQVQALAERYGIITLKNYFEEVIRYIKENLRSVDIGTRYETGKYLFLLPETPKEGAETVKHRLQAKLKHIKADLPLPKIEIKIYSCPGELEEKSIQEIFYD